MCHCVTVGLDGFECLGRRFFLQGSSLPFSWLDSLSFEKVIRDDDEALQHQEKDLS
jgi:hypothetical protein